MPRSTPTTRLTPAPSPRGSRTPASSCGPRPGTSASSPTGPRCSRASRRRRADPTGGPRAASRYAVPPMAVEESDMSTAAPEPSVHPIEERLEQLAERRERALHARSEASVQRQHERGKLTARERIDLLVDPGSFHELDMLARHRAHGFGIENNRPLTDGVITGWGTVDGRKIFLFAQDFTIFGGALGEVFAEKIHKVMDLAASVGAPFVGLNDGAGARIQEASSRSRATAGSSTG